MNPAFAYQRRLRRAVARLSETVQLSRPLPGGGVQIVTARPLIVPAAASLTAQLGGTARAEGDAPPDGAAMDAVYAGFAARLLTGATALAQPAPQADGSTATVHAALLLLQDVSQSPAAPGDTFARDGAAWTVRAVADQLVADQLVAGQVIAVLSLADVDKT